MNKRITVFESAARTADPTTYDGDMEGGKGLILIIDVTAISATPSVVLTVQGLDHVSDSTYDILASAAITGTGTTRIAIYPGMPAEANLKEDEPMPRHFKVKAVHGDADSITYSVGGYILD